MKSLRIAFELFLVTEDGWGITYCGPGLLCDEWGLYHEAGKCDCDQDMTAEEGQHILQDHKWIDNPEDGIRQIGLALRNLPNLTTVEISGLRPEYAASRRLINPVTSMYGSHSYADWYNLSGKKQFEIFMRAVIEAGEDFHLTDLSIKDFRDSLHGEHLNGVHAGIIFSSPEYLGLAKLAFKNMEKITWFYPMYTRVYASNQQKALNGLLRTMPLLKEMSLSDSSRHHKPFDIPDILGDITWKDLHTLRFHKMQFEGRELYEFAGRHSSTLRFLNLGCARIIYPTFKFFLLKMRELCCKLEKFELVHDVCVYTDKGEWKVPMWYGGEESEAQHRMLVRALGDFVTRKVDDYPHEVLRRCMQRNRNQLSAEAEAGTEFVEDESEDAMEKV